MMSHVCLLSFFYLSALFQAHLKADKYDKDTSFHLMKTIIRGQDDIVYRLQIEKQDGTEFLLSDFDDFEIAVFTSDLATNYIVESEFIDADDNLIRIPAEKIATLDDGVIRSYLQDGIVRLQITTSLVDSKFPDGNYSQTNIVNTNYYLKTVTE